MDAENTRLDFLTNIRTAHLKNKFPLGTSPAFIIIPQGFGTPCTPKIVLRKYKVILLWVDQKYTQILVPSWNMDTKRSMIFVSETLKYRPQKIFIRHRTPQVIVFPLDLALKPTFLFTELRNLFS